MPEISEANETGPVTWVLDDENLAWLGESLLNSERIVVDLETTGLDEYAWEGGPKNGGVGARISLASFTLPQARVDAFGSRQWDGATPVTWVLPCSHPDSPWRGKWRRILRVLFAPVIKARIPIENQNVKFDARWLYATCGVDISDLIVWDTKDGQHLLDENSSTKLKEFVPRVFKVPAWNDFDLSTPGASEQVPLLDLGAYAARDTWWTWRAGQYQREAMFLMGDDEVFDQDDRMHARIGRLASWIAMPTVASLTKAEQRGMLLDVEWTKKTLAEDERIATETLDEMARISGMDRGTASTAPTSHWFRDFTMWAVYNSDLEITAYTASDQPQWNKYVLGKQARRGSSIAEMILRQREHTKRAEFLRAWLGYATPEGVIHASFNSGSVKTGRLSSSNPNLQQVTKKLRPAFIARPGFVIADFDYSQVELRVAAVVARCEPMIKAFQEGADLHRRFAAVINQIAEDEVTALLRQQAKAGNFGLLYEMSAMGFQIYAENSYGVVLTIEEAVRIHTAFFETWAGMREWHDRVKRQVHRDGYVTSPLGRVRRLPTIWDGSDKMVSGAERQAINSPVQSMASDLLQLGMASVQGLLQDVSGLGKIDGVFPVATVHDSIVMELEEDGWQERAEAVKERMENLDEVLAKFDVDFDVPLLADYAVGTRWSLSDVSDPQDDHEPLPIAPAMSVAELTAVDA